MFSLIAKIEKKDIITKIYKFICFFNVNFIDKGSKTFVFINCSLILILYL